MNKEQVVVKVGIADLNIVTAPNTIRTSGLGSCVGVVIYDQYKDIAGLAHVMLPDSKLTKQIINMNTQKFADTAIDELIDLLVAQGARKYGLKAKIAGGAQMFKFTSTSDIMRIGPRNVEAVLARLQMHKIPLLAKDVGGNCGRTIEFNPITRKLHIRTVNKGETYI